MTIVEIQRDYEVFNGGHWFDRDTLRFWGTRLSAQTFTSLCDPSRRTYFVTSEYGPFRDTAVRLYSVRVYDPQEHRIDTVSFQAHKTLAQAVARAKLLAGAA